MLSGDAPRRRSELVSIRRRGAEHAKTKLTDAQVIAIRADDRLLKVIADQYGIAVNTVGYIQRGDTWKHLPGAREAWSR